MQNLRNDGDGCCFDLALKMNSLKQMLEIIYGEYFRLFSKPSV
jgi:hypothetical protein